MFIISNSPRAETLHSTALVAFNPATGRVYGTFVHSSYEVNDRAGVARSREHFLKDLAARSEQKTAKMQILELPIDRLPAGAIVRVDPKSHHLITATHSHLSVSAVIKTRPASKKPPRRHSKRAKR